MTISRRAFSRSCVAVLGGAFVLPRVGRAQTDSTSTRQFHLSISPDAIEADPELLQLAHNAGVTDVWLTGFLYGYWHYPLDKTKQWGQRCEKLGLAWHLINVPLGHPGDSLGAKSGDVPLTPPKHWRLATGVRGATYAGTSLHAPATEENCAAVRKIQEAGIDRLFLDDDFRLARGPGIIGGCFCDEHKQAFLKRTGFAESRWDELRDDVDRRSLTDLVRAWVEFTCDQLSDCFHAQQQAAPKIQLGNMIMYLGSEKAGIRLNNYRDVPFRVGELMFEDASFAPIKGKTNELFSALFHRRFARPELAFSETTAFPANRLSARNMAAKLAVSTISDVRTTMFMSGISAFPREHWATLGPAMKQQAATHAKLAGHVLRGPFKHFWGEGSRFVGDDNPFSLFLALGVPFEVTNEPAADGFTFLADADGNVASGAHPAGAHFIARPRAGLPENVRAVPETLPDLWAFRREILPRLDRNVPFVVEETPVVCAWYPTTRTVLLWNLDEGPKELTLRIGETNRAVRVEGLATALVEEIG